MPTKIYPIRLEDEYKEIIRKIKRYKKIKKGAEAVREALRYYNEKELKHDSKTN